MGRKEAKMDYQKNLDNQGRDNQSLTVIYFNL